MARRMKDSGIEWIGEIPEEWEVIPHKYVMHKEKSICEHHNGEDIISLTMNGVIVRDLTAGGKMPTTFDGYQYVEPEDMLLCLFDIDVTPRCVGIVRNHGVTSPAYSRFKVHAGYYNAYYDYLLRFIDDEKVFIHLSKNLRSSLTETDFGVIKTLAPSLAEQHRIAAFLDRKCAEIDAVIERTKATIEEYKKLKQAVITEAVTKGVRGPRPMKDSGIERIGEIPEEWEVTRVKHVASRVTDGAHVSPELENGVYDFVSTVNLSNGRIDFENCLKTSEQSYWQFVNTGCQPHKNDVLISKDGTVGKTAIVDFEHDFVVASSLVIISPLCDVVIPAYLNYNLQAKFTQDALLLLMHGAGLKRVSIEKNANLTVVLPPYSEQEAIVSYLDDKCAALDTLIAKKTALLTELEIYKKSLIYEYVTGKKEVTA